jgi:hypothetical protein
MGDPIFAVSQASIATSKFFTVRYPFTNTASQPLSIKAQIRNDLLYRQDHGINYLPYKLLMPYL